MSNLTVGSWVYIAVPDACVDHQHSSVRWGHPETSEVWTIACSVHQCPKLAVLSVMLTHHLFPSVTLAASACTRHDFWQRSIGINTTSGRVTNEIKFDDGDSLR